VVRISSSNIVVLDVNRRNVPVDKRLLEIRYRPPEHWTVVQCEPRVLQRVGRVFPLTYAVCPSCRNRQAFEAGKSELTCDRCRNTAPLTLPELAFP
jgi:tRNA(Ile2) C34 agmatinyltransferase TiaS